MTYRIDIITSGVRTTVNPDIGFNYTKNLNDVNEAMIKISGTGVSSRSVYKINSRVEIFKDDVLDFIGVIDMIDKLDAGGLSIHISGFEVWLSKEKGTYASSPYKNTASATIFDDILSDAGIIEFYTLFSKGSIATGFNVDERFEKSSSIYSSLSRLATTTQQDIEIDYTNKLINIVDHTGSSTSIGVFNDGIDIRNIRETEGYPEANHVKVYGQGEGTNQKFGEAEDATSIATYGRITKVVTDRTILTDTQAGLVAPAELAIAKEPIDLLDFEFNNPYTDVSLGDILTINSPDKDISSKNYRIIKVIRGEQGDSDILSVQVATTNTRKGIKDRNKLFAEINQTNNVNNTYKQGFQNISEWVNYGNLNSSIPVYVNFNINDSFFDELDDSTVQSITLDYELDKFKLNFDGVAEYDGSDIPVQGASGNTAPDVENDSDPNAENSIVDEDDTSFTSTSVDGNTWTEISTFNDIPQNGDGIVFYGSFVLAGHDDPTTRISYSVRIKNKNTGIYFPSSSGIRIGRGKYRLEVSAGEVSLTTDTDGDHRHEPDDNRWFMTTNADGTATIDYRPYTTYNGDHNHSITSGYILNPFNMNFTIPVPENPYLKDYAVEFFGLFSSSDNCLIDGYTAYDVQSRHTHGPGDYNAKLHPHGNGTYEADGTEIGTISIDEGVSLSASIKATDVSVSLEYYNGSSWVVKNAIGLTGAIRGTDLDLSDSGTYPDASGSWRVKLLTNNAGSDFIGGIVKIKYNIN